MQISTPQKRVPKNDKAVYDFVVDLQNFKRLMPESTEKFEMPDADTFVFALRGMPEITLKRREQVPYEKLVLGAADPKLQFTLTVGIVATKEEESEVSFLFEGEFNTMIGMMIKSPITNFLRTLSDNLDRI